MAISEIGNQCLLIIIVFVIALVVVIFFLVLIIFVIWYFHVFLDFHRGINAIRARQRQVSVEITRIIQKIQRNS